jgi:D-alanyl-D-alanine carboxypeptidase (penicillin-binding protein 5/6)
VNLNDQVTVSEDAASYAGSVYSNVGLYPYDRVSVRDLLTAALVPSGTDADYALAEYLGDGSADEFVGKMNDKAKELGLKNTHYENPAGIDARGNYSSAADLAKISRAAMKYPEFRKIVALPEATISTQDREIVVVNTNLLVVPNSGYEYGPGTAWSPRPRAATNPTSPWSSTPPVTCSVSTRRGRRSSTDSASTNTSPL